MTVSGAFDGFAAEVEAVIHAPPAVLDVAVVGVPDETRGEAIRPRVFRQRGRCACAGRL